MSWNWWVLVLVIPGYWLQLVLHELSHVVVGWIHEKRKPTGFYPYPHCHEGRFYFARYSLGPGKFGKYYYLRPGLPRHVAPMWAGLIWGTAWWVLAVVFESVWFLPFAICGIGDALWFWRGYFWGTPGCDGKRWRYGDPK
mgnify:CR=1 FL=1